MYANIPNLIFQSYSTRIITYSLQTNSSNSKLNQFSLNQPKFLKI